MQPNAAGLRVSVNGAGHGPEPAPYSGLKTGAQRGAEAANAERTVRCEPRPPRLFRTPGVSPTGKNGVWAPLPLSLGPGLRLAARWNRLVETVKTRKKRGGTGEKWARYGLKGAKESGSPGPVVVAPHKIELKKWVGGTAGRRRGRRERWATNGYGRLNYRTAARTLFLWPDLAHFCSFFAVFSVFSPSWRQDSRQCHQKTGGRLRNGGGEERVVAAGCLLS